MYCKIQYDGDLKLFTIFFRIKQGLNAFCVVVYCKIQYDRDLKFF